MIRLLGVTHLRLRRISARACSSGMPVSPEAFASSSSSSRISSYSSMLRMTATFSPRSFTTSWRSLLMQVFEFGIAATSKALPAGTLLIRDQSRSSSWQRCERQQAEKRRENKADDQPRPEAPLFLAGDIGGEKAGRQPHRNEKFHFVSPCRFSLACSLLRGRKEDNRKYS